MKTKTFLLAILVLILLPVLGFFNVQPVSAGTTICGQYKRITHKDSSGIEWEYYSFDTSDNKSFGISNLPSEGYYRIHDTVIAWNSSTMTDGTHSDGSITSWSSYERITGLQDCNQAPTQQPPVLPTHTQLVYPTVPPILTTTIPIPLPVPTLARVSPTPVQPPTPLPPTSIPVSISTLPIGVYPVGTYPDYKQDVGSWSTLKYGPNTSSEYTIAGWGCNLTDVANLLVYYGATDTDPGTLNTWLDSHGGYDTNPKDFGGVIPGPLNSYSSSNGHQIMKYIKTVDWDNTKDNMQADIYKSLSNNWPVILKYYMPGPPAGFHFVVAMGVIQVGATQEYIIKDPLAGTYFINLPYSPITVLAVDDSRIPPRIRQAIFYQPADGIIRSSMIIKGHSPIAYVLIDGQGRRLGYDPVSDTHYWEIPNGNYAYNLPIWDPLVQPTSATVGESLEADLPDANAGNYRLIVYDTGNGPYEIDTFYTDELNQTNQAMVNGTAQTGSIQNYDIQVGQGSVRMAINDQGSTGSSSGGGLGLVLILVILMVGGVSIPVFRSLARKRISYAHPSTQPVLVDPSGHRINVTLADFTIGRSSSCSLRLSDPTVSRQHACLRYASRKWYIQDMNSAGGTYVNGTRVNATPLNNGDRIRVGSTEFEFNE